MSRFARVGKLAVKYGPHAKVLWQHAAKPVGTAAQRAVASRSALRHALDHADTLVEGAILRIVVDGDPVWVVYSGATPVTTYPKVDGDLTDLVANVNTSRKITPDAYRERQAQASKSKLAWDAAKNLKDQVQKRNR